MHFHVSHIYREGNQGQIIWHLELQVLKFLLGGNQLWILQLVLYKTILMDGLVLDFVSVAHYNAMCSFSPLKSFPIGIFLRGFLPRHCWGRNTIILFRQNYLDHPLIYWSRSFVFGFLALWGYSIVMTLLLFSFINFIQRYGGLCMLGANFVGMQLSKSFLLANFIQKNDL